MSLNRKKAVAPKGGKFEPLEPGSYAARVVAVIDLGVQVQEYKGELKDPVSMFRVVFELPSETIEYKGEDMPRWLAKDYTMYTSEKAAYPKLLTALKMDDEDPLTEMIDRTCTLSVGMNKKNTHNRIEAVTAPMRGVKIGKLKHDPYIFDFDEPDAEVWLKKLPDFVKEMIQGAENYEEDLAEWVDSLDEDDEEEAKAEPAPKKAAAKKKAAPKKKAVAKKKKKPEPEPEEEEEEEFEDDEEDDDDSPY